MMEERIADLSNPEDEETQKRRRQMTAAAVLASVYGPETELDVQTDRAKSRIRTVSKDKKKARKVSRRSRRINRKKR